MKKIILIIMIAIFIFSLGLAKEFIFDDAITIQSSETLIAGIFTFKPIEFPEGLGLSDHFISRSKITINKQAISNLEYYDQFPVEIPIKDCYYSSTKKVKSLSNILKWLPLSYFPVYEKK